MLAFAISAAVVIFIYSLIVCLFGKQAAFNSAVRSRLYNLGKNVANEYLIGAEGMDKPFSERVIQPLIKKITHLLTNLLPFKSVGKNGNEKQRKMLQQAGWTISVEEYAVLQFILMMGCGLIGVIAAVIMHKDASNTVLYFVFGMFAAYSILRFICSSVGGKRQEAMEKQLPDMLDLLSVSVAAGLGFERAMLHIVETMDGPLIDEFAVAYREMSMGRSRKDALTLLGERCGVEDLSSVTGAIVQAGQLGIPLRNVLQSQAAAIRNSRRSKVQEKAAKVSTKMLLPMIGLIFPVLIIVLMGPSIITLMEQFG